MNLSDEVKIDLYDFSQKDSRIAATCPKCARRSFYKLSDTVVRDSIPNRFSASCFSSACRHSFYILAWEPSGKNGGQRKFFGKEQVIPILPCPDCDECKGTGKYVGLVKVETCSKCAALKINTG